MLQRLAMNFDLKDSSHSPVYVQVREQLEAHIRNKDIGSGETLPSPSSLSQKLSVDKGEILRAYFELELAGLVKKETTKDFLGKPRVTYRVK
jgi:DNA-binding transcriptional regulator YhcF (GntR family)